MKTVLAVLAVSYALPTVNANLIGFDFGSSYMKATLVKPGSPFGIVENTASGRKTETMITLGQENRLYGADSLLESGKYPKTSFMEMARFFGQPFEEELSAKLKEQRFIYNEIVADERGQVAWKFMREAYDGEEARE